MKASARIVFRNLCLRGFVDEKVCGVSFYSFALFIREYSWMNKLNHNKNLALPFLSVKLLLCEYSCKILLGCLANFSNHRQLSIRSATADRIDSQNDRLDRSLFR
jgi:hypothetical protein